MASFLLVGDPHVVPEEMADCRRLADCIVDAIEKHKPENLVFLGDQHHNHSLVHVDVLAYWHETFARIQALPSPPRVFALVGNHDMSSDKSSTNHAMRSYERQILVVSSPIEISGVLLMPYCHSPDVFKKAVAAFKCKTVICHQTLDGSRYENGFYSQDGVDITDFSDRYFISGHIHTPQKFGNVVYVGAPRWRSVSDADIERGLTLWDIDGEPKLKLIQDTSAYCEKLVHLIDNQDAPLAHEMNPQWRYIVDIYGDELFVASRKAVWKGARIRTFVKTKGQQPVVRESMGISQAIKAYTSGFLAPFGTPTATLEKMVAERVSV